MCLSVTGYNSPFERYGVLDPKKFAETVAVNRGMLIRVFDNLEEALEWLATPPADNPNDR
jgi:hypothetical protein